VATTATFVKRERHYFSTDAQRMQHRTCSADVHSTSCLDFLQSSVTPGVPGCEQKRL